jgi:uncharacterized Zn-finger protein
VPKQAYLKSMLRVDGVTLPPDATNSLQTVTRSAGIHRHVIPTLCQLSECPTNLGHPHVTVPISGKLDRGISVPCSEADVNPKNFPRGA